MLRKPLIVAAAVLPPRTPQLGGQALPEGVLIRSPARWSIAVRRPDGGIHVESHDVDGSADSRSPLRRSVLRGLFALGEAVRIGLRGLQVSVRVGMGGELTHRQLAMSVGPVFASLILVFVAGPSVAVGATDVDGIAGDAFEAGVRIAMLVLYLLMVSRSRSARQLFSFHGAEHKAIAAYERSGVVPRRGEARAASPIHTRCGTNFLTLFLFSSGVVYAFVPRQPLVDGAFWRIVLVPVAAVIAYELMRAAARAEHAIWPRLVVWPGRALQRITTREPTDDQLEVALAALYELLGPAGPEGLIPP